MLQLKALGGLTFELDSEHVQFTARVDEALLAYLIAQNRPIPRDQLTDLLWQNSDPQQANNNFRSALSRLRKRVGDYLIVTRQTVAFDTTQPHRFDVTQFEAALVELRPLLDSATGLNADQQAALTEAIGLYQGEFLAGFVVKGSSAEFDAWVLFMQERLRILASAGLTYLTQHATHNGAITTGLTYASQLVQLDPLNESAHQLKMRLHLRNRDRSAALKQYAQCQQLLADELATEPLASTSNFFQQLQNATPDANNLPRDPSPFIGRVTLVQDVVTQLFADDRRLITVTGIGGIGKTRLALTVARHFVGRLLHGAYYVPLVGVHDPAGAAQVLASVLGLVLDGVDSAEKTITDHLHKRECLLLFDNYEPLLSHPDGTALLEQLLLKAPAVRLLITSRETLSLYEESVIQLDGLTTEAPTLFTQHATRISANTQAVTAPQITHLCTLLHGVPLAIELAAGNLQTHDLATIIERISTSLDTLQTTMRNVPPRQRSLRAVFDYSFQLLTETQQDSLARLALFVDSFHEDAASAIGVSTATLHALISKSLLQPQPENRYVLHPLIREFANEQLHEPGRSNLQQVFAEHYGNTFERWSGLMDRGQIQDSLAAWQLDHANVVQAWRWAIKLRHLALVQQLELPIGSFHRWRNWYVSAEILYAHAAEQLADWGNDSGQPAQILGKILERYAYFAFVQGRFDDAIKRMQDALPVIERGGDTVSPGLWRRDMVQILTKAGDYAAARKLVSDFVATSDPATDPAAHANLLINSSHVFKDSGDYKRCDAMLNEARLIFEELGDTRRILMCQYALANSARANGEYARAIALFRDCLAARIDLGDTRAIANTQATLADALYNSGELDEARELAEAACEKYAEIDDKIGWPYPLNVLGNIARDRGDRAAALAHYQDALEMALAMKRQMKAAEVMLDWLLLMRDSLDRAVFVGGLVFLAGWHSAEAETRRLAQQALDKHATLPYPKAISPELLIQQMRVVM